MSLAVSPLDRAVVLGLDPSLRAFGYAWGPGRQGVLHTPASGLPRLQWLRDAVGTLVEHLRAHGPLHLAVVESLYPGTSEAFIQERAALFWMVLDKLSQLDVPTAVSGPQYVKMLATGKGSGKGTDKPAVVAEARDRLGYRGTDNNEADALWLAELGYQHLGQPSVKLPAQHLRALSSVVWPR